MIKSIPSLICLLFITTIGWSQESNILNTSPAKKSQTIADKWKKIELEYKHDWRENSVGLVFLPIPLNFNNIVFEFPSASDFAPFEEKLFSVGIGASLNFDFNKSGSGFGSMAHFAFILSNGDSEFQAYDIFMALKYDIQFGPLSRFEISPLAGVGNLTFQDTDTKLNFGSSLYFSGGIRVTWIAAPGFFVGADIKNAPLIFNTSKLLGVEGVLISNGSNFQAATDVKVEYSFPVEVNFSLRYNLF